MIEVIVDSVDELVSTFNNMGLATCFDPATGIVEAELMFKPGGNKEEFLIRLRNQNHKTKKCACCGGWGFFRWGDGTMQICDCGGEAE